MFESQFDDLIPTPTQFPKTDINFYMLANNASALQPWNKTTSKFIPTERSTNLGLIRRRNLSNQSYQRGIKYHKKKLNTSMKHQITPSTLTFFLTTNNSIDKKVNKKTNVFIRSRRNLHHNHEDQSKTSPDLGAFMTENITNRGLPTTLRHTNLLKLKQEHQNKVKQILSKKQLDNKNTKIKITRFERSSQFDKQIGQSVSVNNIILGEQPMVLNTHDVIKKPRKASFVGIRKLLNLSSAEKYV